MEEAFEFVETPDQMRAINEVKADMESDEPMDRLICGDVGFGKTEVAMRAIFKAITFGKQVAVVVPTTILSIFKQCLKDLSLLGFMLNCFQDSGVKKSSKIR